MSLASLMSERVTWLKYTPGAVDAHGGPTPTWIDNGDVPAYVEPTGSNELLGDRDTVSTDWLVVVPMGTMIQAADRLVYRKLTFEIMGDPAHRRAPGRESHVEITARVVTG